MLNKTVTKPHITHYNRNLGALNSLCDESVREGGDEEPPSTKNRLYFNARIIFTVGSQGKRLWGQWTDFIDGCDIWNLHRIGFSRCSFRYSDFW